jgi:glycerol-3-phosphate dehydrogenase
MPICEQIYNILYCKKSVPEAAKDLLSRDIKEE